MSDVLFRRLERVRTKARQLCLVSGLSWLIIVLFGGTLAAGCLDWAFHFDDPGLRLLLAGAILAGTAAVAWKHLLQPLLAPLTLLDVALKIEQRFPALRDSLASSVQFAESGADPRLGSPELQRSLVARTSSEIDHINLSDVIDAGPVRKTAAAAMAVCLVTAAFVGLQQANAAIALRRLMTPFAHIQWPRSTELEWLTPQLQPLAIDFDDPLVLARGSRLELFVANRKGSLPDDLQLELRRGERQPSIERLRRATLRDADGKAREVSAVKLRVDEGPLELRVSGGDHRDMPWLRIDVAPPPALTRLQVTLTPPAYSGRPPEKLPAGVGHLEGLIGTEVSIQAAVNKPLRNARLRIRNSAAQAIPLSEDGREFHTRFTIQEPGVYSYWFELTDRQGFQNPEASRYEIRGISDLIPDVVIERPEVDLTVTPTAEVPLRITAKDDLGLREMRMLFRTTESESSEGRSLPLFEANGQPVPQHTVDLTWKLEELRLSPGMRVVFYVEATDEYTLGSPHIGRSISRTLHILGPEEKQAELAARQAELIDELDQNVELQDQAFVQTGEIQTQLEKAGGLRTEDIDLLKRIELDQRQVAARLVEPVTSVLARAQQVREELERNQLEAVEMRRGLTQLIDELDHLRVSRLPAIGEQITQIRKQLQLESGEQTEGGESSGERRQLTPTDESALQAMRNNQRAVLEALRDVRRQLSQWRSRRDLSEDLDSLVNNQQDLNERTADLGRRTIGKPLGQLTPQEQADLAKLSDRQTTQAQRFEELKERLKQAISKADPNAPAGDDALRDTQRAADDSEAASHLRRAAAQLNQNRVGDALTAQRSALDELQELKNILENRRETDAELLVKQLQAGEAALEELRKETDDFLRKVQEAHQLNDPHERDARLEQLRKEAAQLRDRMDAMSRQLRRLRARRAEQAVARATERLDRVESLLKEPEAAEQLQETLDDLEQAQRELAQERREAEEELARELLERVSDELAAMIGRQQNVINETQRLEQERQARGNWSRAQLKSLQGLEQTQRGLQQETERLIEQVKVVEVFSLALKGAAREMSRAADRLAERLTDEQTVAVEQAARQRFVDLVAALKPEPPGPEGGQPGNPGGADQPEQLAGPQGETIPPLAQLKMLKTMQADLLRRTAELDAQRTQNGGLTPEQQEDLDALALEQGQLADLARNLMRTLAPQETLPDDAAGEADDDDPQKPKQTIQDDENDPDKDAGDALPLKVGA